MKPIDEMSPDELNKAACKALGLPEKVEGDDMQMREFSPATRNDDAIVMLEACGASFIGIHIGVPSNNPTTEPYWVNLDQHGDCVTCVRGRVLSEVACQCALAYMENKP